MTLVYQVETLSGRQPCNVYCNLAHLVTRFDSRLLVHQSYEQKLRKLYRESVLTTVIPEASVFKVSLACRQPVTYYSPKSKATALTASLGREVRQRISELTAKREVA